MSTPASAGGSSSNHTSPYTAARPWMRITRPPLSRRYSFYQHHLVRSGKTDALISAGKTMLKELVEYHVAGAAPTAPYARSSARNGYVGTSRQATTWIRCGSADRRSR